MKKCLSIWNQLFLLILSSLVSNPPLQASPCTPTDPDGVNPGNLCLTYPTHGMSLNSKTFRQGYASDGYYGTPTGPNQPGTPIQAGHIRGTRMDARDTVNGSGYWTYMKATNGSSTLRTNTGKEWNINVVNP